MGDPSDVNIDDYLDALSSSSATPGGGSAATLVGALAASLIAMVARVSAEGKRYAERVHECNTIASEADALRHAFRHAGERDERAYAAVVAAMKLSKTTEAEAAERREILQTALAKAAEEPLAAVGLALRTLRLCRRAFDLHNRALMSDVGCAYEFARACLNASSLNVDINHAYMTNTDVIETQAMQLATYQREAQSLFAHWTERAS